MAGVFWIKDNTSLFNGFKNKDYFEASIEVTDELGVKYVAFTVTDSRGHRSYVEAKLQNGRYVAHMPYSKYEGETFVSDISARNIQGTWFYLTPTQKIFIQETTKTLSIKYHNTDKAYLNK